MLRFGGYLLRFHFGERINIPEINQFGKIIAHLTSPFKKRFFNWPIKFPGSNLDSSKINVECDWLGALKRLNCPSHRSDLPTSTTRSDGRSLILAPGERPLASRVCEWARCCDWLPKQARWMGPPAVPQEKFLKSQL